MSFKLSSSIISLSYGGPVIFTVTYSMRERSNDSQDRPAFAGIEEVAIKITRPS